MLQRKLMGSNASLQVAQVCHPLTFHWGIRFCPSPTKVEGNAFTLSPECFFWSPTDIPSNMYKIERGKNEEHLIGFHGMEKSNTHHYLEFWRTGRLLWQKKPKIKWDKRSINNDALCCTIWIDNKQPARLNRVSSNSGKQNSRLFPGFSPVIFTFFSGYFYNLIRLIFQVLCRRFPRFFSF